MKTRIHNLRKYLKAIIPAFVFIFFLQISRGAQAFEIKGLQLGQSAEVACVRAISPVKFIDEMVIDLQKLFPKMKLIGSSDCEVSVETFAGKEINGPIQLLFMKNKLIQVKFSLISLDLSQAAELQRSIQDNYGKRKLKHSKLLGFSVSSWSKENQTLETYSKTSSDPKYTDVEIILSDKAAVLDVMRKFDYNSQVIEQSKRSLNKNDVR